ncbi:hypothetical protein TNCV_1641611 [Trichonephila clavipes]|nr:hypothetical protein TNCV_1641611 [Trichonephila clavipes]
MLVTMTSKLQQPYYMDKIPNEMLLLSFDCGLRSVSIPFQPLPHSHSRYDSLITAIAPTLYTLQRFGESFLSTLEIQGSQKSIASTRYVLHTGYDNYIVIQAVVYLVVRVRHKCAFVSAALEKNSLVFTKLAVPAKLSNVLQKEREKG